MPTNLQSTCKLSKLTYCTGTDEGWHQTEESWQVAMEETDDHEDGGEGHVGVGSWRTNMVHHLLCWSCWLLAYHHHILKIDESRKKNRTMADVELI